MSIVEAVWQPEKAGDIAAGAADAGTASASASAPQVEQSSPAQEETKRQAGTAATDNATGNSKMESRS